MAATTFSFRNEFLGLVIPASRLAQVLGASYTARAVRAARRGEKSSLDKLTEDDFKMVLETNSKSLLVIQTDWKNTLECQATRTRFWDNYAKLEKLYASHAEHSKIQDALQRDIWAAEKACRLVADLINEEETPTKEQFEALEFAQGVHKELLTQAKVLEMQARDLENDIQKVVMDQLTTQRRLGELGISNTVPPAIHKQNRERYLSRVKPKRAAKENKNIVQAPNQNQMEAGLVV